MMTHYGQRVQLAALDGDREAMSEDFHQLLHLLCPPGRNCG